MEFVSTPSPHFIPGYTGFCPQYRYHVGDTFGTTTHKLLLDPNVDHAENLVLAHTTPTQQQVVVRPPDEDIEIVNSRGRTIDSLFRHPMIPGYDGFVPREPKKFGERYSVQATEAIAEFERFQNNYTQAFDELDQMVRKQSAGGPRELNESTLKEMSRANEFKIPLVELRPDHAGVLRTLPTEDPNGKPPRDARLTDYLHDTEPKGQSSSDDGQFGCACYGENYKRTKDSSVCDFVANYRKRLSTEWAPPNVNLPDPPFIIEPCKIYHRHIGQLPNYAGHIPGQVFRYGKTFGNDTRDAKRWLRGDFKV